MLLALLIYGYGCGERSSRRIERLCTTDVAFRVICAQDVPDHTVIARFRQERSADPRPAWERIAYVWLAREVDAGQPVDPTVLRAV